MSFRKFISNRNEKIKVKKNKPVNLGLSILEISTTLTYEFWHDYIQPKYKYNASIQILRGYRKLYCAY